MAASSPPPRSDARQRSVASFLSRSTSTAFGLGRSALTSTLGSAADLFSARRHEPRSIDELEGDDQIVEIWYDEVDQSDVTCETVGNLADLADVVLYPNTARAVKIRGGGGKEDFLRRLGSAVTKHSPESELDAVRGVHTTGHRRDIRSDTETRRPAGTFRARGRDGRALLRVRRCALRSRGDGEGRRQRGVTRGRCCECDTWTVL